MSSTDVILVAHDAGGAELLSSWVRSQHGPRWLFCLAGPAEAVFRRKLGTIANLGFPELEAALEAGPPGMLVSGTSWQSGLESEARALARRRGIRTVAYLDHWVNYRERFGYPGPWIERLPDEIWCPDSESLEVCLRDGFPPARLVLKGNPYLDGMVADMADPRASATRGSVLYVSEPVGEHMEKFFGDRRHLGYDEYDALRHFFASARRWAEPPSRIVVRPHPSERPDKYDGFLEPFRASLPVERSDGSPLADEINRAECVVGCESMAMVVALKLGKRVLTSIPTSGRACRLPFAAIRAVDDPTLIPHAIGNPP